MFFCGTWSSWLLFSPIVLLRKIKVRAVFRFCPPTFHGWSSACAVFVMVLHLLHCVFWPFYFTVVSFLNTGGVCSWRSSACWCVFLSHPFCIGAGDLLLIWFSYFLTLSDTDGCCFLFCCSIVVHVFFLSPFFFHVCWIVLVFVANLIELGKFFITYHHHHQVWAQGNNYFFFISAVRLRIERIRKGEDVWILRTIWVAAECVDGGYKVTKPNLSRTHHHHHHHLISSVCLVPHRSVQAKRNSDHRVWFYRCHSRRVVHNFGLALWLLWFSFSSRRRCGSVSRRWFARAMSYPGGTDMT